jgi:hypothetical protein
MNCYAMLLTGTESSVWGFDAIAGPSIPVACGWYRTILLEPLVFSCLRWGLGLTCPSFRGQCNARGKQGATIVLRKVFIGAVQLGLVAVRNGNTRLEVIQNHQGRYTAVEADNLTPDQPSGTNS